MLIEFTRNKTLDNGRHCAVPVSRFRILEDACLEYPERERSSLSLLALLGIFFPHSRASLPEIFQRGPRPAKMQQASTNKPGKSSGTRASSGLNTCSVIHGSTLVRLVTLLFTPAFRTLVKT